MSWSGPYDLAHSTDDPTAAARVRLADAVRRLTTATVGRPLDAAALHAAAAEAERVAEKLEAAAGPGKAPRTRTDASGRRVWMPTSPMMGPENPLAPPARIRVVDGPEGPELRGTVRFGYAYEGPPTCVHGGALAELFDEVLGAALVVAERPGMTGTLTVRYRRPTPLMADLDVVARPTTQEGRKIGAWAGVYHDGELTAEADGIFIAVQPGAMARVVRANETKAGAAVVDDELRVLLEGDAPIPEGD